MKMTDRIVRYILEEIEGKEILEAACGTAEFSLSAAGYAKKITCIDIDESRLDKLVRGQENICFRVMDASKMDFGNNTFDTVILYNALYHIKGQYDEILTECRRVLKPEGHIFLIATWNLDLALMREKFGSTMGRMEDGHFVREELPDGEKNLGKSGIVRLGKYPINNEIPGRIQLYKPQLEDLWFRKEFMGDETTMSYNHAWGGTIPFPESKWPGWYDYWMVHHDNKRFYRYLKKTDPDEFVGEIAYHFDEDKKVWIADIIIASMYRGRGYGTQGVDLLCKAAAKNGIEILYDDMAIDNPALSLFLKNGFQEEYRTGEIIMLKKDLRE